MAIFFAECLTGKGVTPPVREWRSTPGHPTYCEMPMPLNRQGIGTMV